jgi:hypothetical protein
VLQPGVNYMDLNLELQKRGEFVRALFGSPAAERPAQASLSSSQYVMTYANMLRTMLMGIHSWIPVRVLPWEVRAERLMSRRYPR